MSTLMFELGCPVLSALFFCPKGHFGEISWEN